MLYQTSLQIITDPMGEQFLEYNYKSVLSFLWKIKLLMMLALPALAIMLLSSIFADSRTSGPAATDMVKKWSFVRGIQAYNDKWEPRIGEILCLQRQAEKNGTVVGYVPRRLAPIFSPFLNRGVRLGLEAPCVYCLYGPVVYIERTKQLMIQAANN